MSGFSGSMGGALCAPGLENIWVNDPGPELGCGAGANGAGAGAKGA